MAGTSATYPAWGALDPQLLRACRLVIDTGMHAMGGTPEQAIAYGLAAGKAERYIAMPGQTDRYMLGMLRIMELRETAMLELGPKFFIGGLS